MAIFVNELELVEGDIAMADLEEVTHVSFNHQTVKHPVDQINVCSEGVVVSLTLYYDVIGETIQVDLPISKFTSKPILEVY